MRLSANGYRVTAVGSAEAALARLSIELPRLVISDIRLPDRDGMALFQEIRRSHPALPVILLTAHGTIPDAVEATTLGAYAYLTKPFDAKLLLERIAQALSLAAPAARAIDGDEQWRAAIISRSQCMDELLAEARLVAASDASILIRGESGTGKELLAQAIHRASRRAQRPSLPSTAARFRKRCWSPNCSATSRAPTPAPLPAAKAWCRRPTAAPCSSTRSATCRCCCSK
jgi:two-component system response regulator GlrR